MEPIMLNRKIGEMNYDGLFTDLVPEAQVRGRTIAGVDATYPRGTAMARSLNDDKIYVLGTVISDDTLIPDCILADDVTVVSGTDRVATVYTAGCFDTKKITVADSYTMTEADLDEFRKRDIVFKEASPEN